MSKPNDKAIADQMRIRRSQEDVASDVASTVFGQLASEAKDSISVPVSSIKPSPFQSRGEIDDSHIEVLMASIASSGLLVPILVRKVSNFDTMLELVAGHNRLEAFRRLGRENIPAIVRTLSDQEAARALTVENTHHKILTDWELFKHLRMLRSAHAVKSVTDMASVLGCSRTHIYNLEAYAALPAEVASILDKRPDLIGGKLAYDLREHAEKHPAIVTEAALLLADGKLKQAGVIGWVQRRADPPAAPYRKEVTIKGSGATVKLVITDGEAKVSGGINFDRLHALIEANLAALMDPPGQESTEI